MLGEENGGQNKRPEFSPMKKHLHLWTVTFHKLKTLTFKQSTCKKAKSTRKDLPGAPDSPWGRGSAHGRGGAQTPFPECSALKKRFQRCCGRLAWTVAGVTRWRCPWSEKGPSGLQVAVVAGVAAILRRQLTTPTLRRPQNKCPSLGRARTAHKLRPGKQKQDWGSAVRSPWRVCALWRQKPTFVFCFRRTRAVDQPSGLCPQGRAVLGLSLLLSSSPRMEGGGGTKTRVVVGEKQTPLQKIGSGCFWDTYVAVGISDGEEVAVKLNLRRPGIPGCAARADPLSLQAGVGIPHTWRCGQETELSVLVVDLLGPSLEDLFSFCSRSFTVKTVLRLAEQMISRVEYMHTENCTHRDINQITS